MTLLKKLNDKRGMGLSTVMGVVVFTTATAVTLFSVTYNQNLRVQTNLVRAEEYATAVNAVRVASHIVQSEVEISASNFVTSIESLISEIGSTNWGAQLVITYDKNSYVITITHPLVTSNKGVTTYLAPSNAVAGLLPTPPAGSTNDLTYYIPLTVNPATGQVDMNSVATNVTEYYAIEYAANNGLPVNDLDNATIPEIYIQSIALANNYTPINYDTTSNIDQIITWADSQYGIANSPINDINGNSSPMIMDDSFVNSSFTVQGGGGLVIESGTTLFVNNNITFRGSTDTIGGGAFFVGGNVSILGSAEVSASLFVNGNVAIDGASSLVIPAGSVLYVEGNLTMSGSSQIKGTVFVKGNVNFSGSNTVASTLYVGGNLTGSSVNFGTVDRPSFWMVNGTTNLSESPRSSNNNYLFLYTNRLITPSYSTLSVRGDVQYETYAGIRYAWSPSILNVTPINLGNYYSNFYDLGLPSISNSGLADGSNGGIVATNPMIR